MKYRHTQYYGFDFFASSTESRVWDCFLSLNDKNMYLAINQNDIEFIMNRRDELAGMTQTELYDLTCYAYILHKYEMADIFLEYVENVAFWDSVLLAIYLTNNKDYDRTRHVQKLLDMGLSPDAVDKTIIKLVALQCDCNIFDLLVQYGADITPYLTDLVIDVILYQQKANVENSLKSMCNRLLSYGFHTPLLTIDHIAMIMINNEIDMRETFTVLDEISPDINKIITYQPPQEHIEIARELQNIGLSEHELKKLLNTRTKKMLPMRNHCEQISIITKYTDGYIKIENIDAIAYGAGEILHFEHHDENVTGAYLFIVENDRYGLQKCLDTIYDQETIQDLVKYAYMMSSLDCITVLLQYLNDVTFENNVLLLLAINAIKLHELRDTSFQWIESNIRWLVEHGADIHIHQDVLTILAMAFSTPTVLELLIELGANINTRAKRLCILAAFNEGCCQHMKLLIDNGIDITQHQTEIFNNIFIRYYMNFPYVNQLWKLLFENGFRIPKMTRAEYFIFFSYADIEKIRLFMDNGFDLQPLRDETAGDLSQFLEKYGFTSIEMITFLLRKISLITTISIYVT